MQTIELADLTHVTGGVFGMQSRDAQMDAQPDASQQQAGGFLAGVDSFLGFLNSDMFQRLVGGARQFLSAFNSQGQSQGVDPQGDDPNASMYG